MILSSTALTLLLVYFLSFTVFCNHVSRIEHQEKPDLTIRQWICFSAVSAIIDLAFGVFFLFSHSDYLLACVLMLGYFSLWMVLKFRTADSFSFLKLQIRIPRDSPLRRICALFLPVMLILLCNPVFEKNASDYRSNPYVALLPDSAPVILLALILILQPAGYVISNLLALFIPKSADSDSDQPFSAEPPSGKIIGYLERIMILIFILCREYSAIAFVFAAKSIIRFRDADKDKSEYFLIGTLLSVVSALTVCFLLGLNGILA